MRLVITRRPGEVFYVGPVLIRVLNVGKNRVRIGIEAPSDVPVYRGELRKASLCLGSSLPPVQGITDDSKPLDDSGSGLSQEEC